MKQNEIQVESISIGLASPIQIRKWAERVLPNGKKVGKVNTSQTVNYKTLKPEPGGLFCEKTFGPVKSFECACGNFNRDKKKIQFCPICDVEFTDSQVRRYRLGYIELAYPVSHIWYVKGRPSFLSLLLGLKRKEVQAIIYGTHAMYLPTLKLFKTKKSAITSDSSTSDSSISDSSILRNRIKKQKNSNTSIATTKQIFLLKKYCISKFQENWDKKNIFTTQFTDVFRNSYYSYLFYLGFQSQQQRNSIKEKLVFLPKKKLQPNHKTNKKNKVFKNASFNLEKDTVKFQISSSLLKKKIFVNSTVKLKKRSSKNSLLKNSFLLDFQQTFSPSVSHKNMGSSHFSKLKSTFSLQSKSVINTYYGCPSNFIVGSVKYEEFVANPEERWNGLTYYMISEVDSGDRVLSNYSYRVLSSSIYKNNTEYTVRGNLESGIKAIWYLLKTLNTTYETLKLRNQIQKLDIEIRKLQKIRFLFLFDDALILKLMKKRLKYIRQFKLFRYFKTNKLGLEWLILSILPVLPPNLRPIVQLDANQVAVSDLNQLYKRVLDRNKRLHSTKVFSPFYKIRYPFSEMVNDVGIKFNRRLLQEAVDALIENGKGGTPPASGLNGQAFKSLSDILKGKKGRFRQNLLGKRVDYSGRSVIIVAPELKLHECGLPKEMAIELFYPFLLRELIHSKNKMPPGKAKKIIKQQKPLVWKVLQSILRTHPILLNRAPTLHRLGIQAFQPKLVEGRAILLHPLVCPAFNADFDGDQMAVHVPLSAQARAEAWNLMWSPNNILSPATSEPIIVPSQDMILGCYYLTTNMHDSEIAYSKYSKLKQQISHIFSNLDEVLWAFHHNKISLHSLILLRSKKIVQIENFYEKPIEIRINFFGNSTQIYSPYWRTVDNQSENSTHFMYTTTGRVLLNKIIFQSLEK